ncbi:MAG: DUF262 domain-containing protein [Prevotella sp.]|nr:DUF262 domain-containing protein [Prevotella sp.]
MEKEELYNEERLQIIVENNEIEDSTESESDSIYYSVSSYGADYSVDVLIKRLEKKQIVVPTFQRKYVWDIKKASRFIESLILGFPVPGIFLSRDTLCNTGNPNQMLIIDGQQRLLSLQKFYNGRFDGKVFKLTGICDELNGKAYNELSSDDQMRLDDAIIHATIIKQETPENDNSSIYMVFERLNTGGMLLQPQEIRACIFYGEFNDLLNELIKNDSWRSLFSKENPRMKEQEMILRFFALYYHYEEYKKGMKKFLNDFMNNNRNCNIHRKEELTSLFVRSIELLVSAVGKEVFRKGKAINAAIFDSIMIGVAKRISHSDMDIKECAEKYASLMQDIEYTEFATTATADEKQVKGRIRMSIRGFA